MIDNKYNDFDFEEEYEEEYEDYDYSFSFVKMSKPSYKVATSKKDRHPKGHQSSIRKAGVR